MVGIGHAPEHTAAGSGWREVDACRGRVCLALALRASEDRALPARTHNGGRQYDVSGSADRFEECVVICPRRLVQELEVVGDHARTVAMQCVDDLRVVAPWDWLPVVERRQ